MGTLFVVATPIGNLEDISPRALRVLREVQLIAAEDTRHTGRLLAHFGITTRLISYHAFNERSRTPVLLDALGTGDVALVSDAGTPGISDPGQAIVAAAIASGFAVSPVPGPSAITAAISASGLIDGPFTFLGFLPRVKSRRRRLLARVSASAFGVVLYEAPGRVLETLHELQAVLGDRRAAILRELTKLHEEIRVERLSALTTAIAEAAMRGEVVIVVAAGEDVNSDQVDPGELVQSLLATGMKPSEAAREAAALSGLPRSELYALTRASRPNTDRRGEDH